MQSLRPWLRPVFLYAALVGLAVALTRFFYFVLLDGLTVYLLPLLWLGLAGLVVVGLVWATVAWARSRQQRANGRSWQGAIPLALLVGMPLVTLLLPLENLWLRLNFYRQMAARQDVIELFETHEIYPSPGMITLPPAYRETSMGGGEVQVFRQNDSLDGAMAILFFTLRVYGGSAGFLYSETGAPLPEDAVSGYTLLEQRPVKDRWYYVRIGG